ncbi:MAG: tetratricopeptide repeat protein [Saprospiraceae bacterium]|nr:tetratricopeptide repeat protein [Saprospiraceae bacterium]
MRVYLILCCLLSFVTQNFAQKSPDRPSEDEVLLEKAFIEASREKILGNYQEAISRYELIVKQDNNNDVAYYELTRLYILLEQYDQAIIQIERAVELKNSEEQYIQLYASLLEKQGNYKKAADIFNTLVEANPQKESLYYDLSYFLTKSGELDQAIKVYTTLEKRIGIRPKASIDKHKIYVNQGKYKKAIYELEKLATAYPKEAEYSAAVAKLHEQTGRLDKARTWYDKVLEISPNHPEANIFMADIFLVEQKDTMQYLKALSSLFSAPEQSVDKKLDAIRPLIQSAEESNNEQQLYLLTQLAQKISVAHSNNNEAHLMYGKLLFRQHQYTAAAQAFNKSTALEKNNIATWELLLEAYLYSGQTNALLKTSKNIMEMYPNHAVGYYFYAMANYRKAEYKTSIDAAKDAVFMAASIPELQGKIYSILGRSYNGIGNQTAAEKTFKDAMAVLADNPDVLSGYAHYLANQKLRLDDASKMAKKAVNLLPNNATHQTAYAWVLHQKGNYEDAKKWFEKALKNGGNEYPETLEKYGDTLYQLKDAENALAYWKLARTKGATSASLNKKITTKQLDPR